MACKLCEEFRKKYPLKNNQHEVSKNIFYAPIKCAFENNNFSVENWNCQTMAFLRDHLDFEKRYNDESIGIICIPENEEFSGFLVMTWYKNRGTTGSAYIMCGGNEPEELILEKAEKIIELLEVKI